VSVALHGVKAVVQTREGSQVTARGLLSRAAALYDAPESPLREAAAAAVWGGFASGAAWMRLALETQRGQACPPTSCRFGRLGVIKYGLASGAALLCAAAIMAADLLWLLPLAVVVFYAVEAQMVFQFPLALDGATQPFRAARVWTVRAGGTVAVMGVVLPLAGTMVLGGLVGRGFLRSWCLGCLAVCLWYETLRVTAVDGGLVQALHIRRETVQLGLSRPVRLLYASDLHLGRRWNRAVPEQLRQAGAETAPELILLGGDLADNAAGLAALQECVRALARVAPVHAVPGNHDRRPGVEAVRAAVEAGGGFWLLERSIDTPVRIEGRVDPAPHEEPRVLCTHQPGEFPAAVAAGYALVLAGHLHGGQCVWFTRQGRLYPAAWLHRWHVLRYVEGDAVLLVSRGVADTLPLRFRCPREVILCEVT
jgi:predicted MPP superfamily phosphohydrolase